MKGRRKRTGIFIIMGFTFLFAVSCEMLTEDVIREGDLVGTWSFDDATAQVYVGKVNITRLLIVSYGYTNEEAELKLDSLVNKAMKEIGETWSLNEDRTYLIDGEGEHDKSGTWDFDTQKNALRLTQSGAETPEKFIVTELSKTTMILDLPNGFEVIDLDEDGEPETNCTIVAEIKMEKVQPVN